MTQFFEGTEGIEAKKIFGHNVAVTFERPQLLRLQYTKLVNYFRDQLINEWGGYFVEEESAPAPEGWKLFEKWIETQDQQSLWIEREFRELPWGPGNCKLVSEPSEELGAPYEAYLSCGEGLLTINQASRLLCTDSAELVELKLKLVYDDLVVLKAMEGMLRPRGTWPKIEVKQGGQGRSVRFVKTRPSNH
jgi:hypothetical protein